MTIEERITKTVKVINGIEERLNKLLDYGERTKNLYILGFVNGLCDYINEEMRKIKNEEKEKG